MVHLVNVIELLTFTICVREDFQSMSRNWTKVINRYFNMCPFCENEEDISPIYHFNNVRLIGPLRKARGSNACVKHFLQFVNNESSTSCQSKYSGLFNITFTNKYLICA